MCLTDTLVYSTAWLENSCWEQGLGVSNWGCFGESLDFRTQRTQPTPGASEVAPVFRNSDRLRPGPCLSARWTSAPGDKAQSCGRLENKKGKPRAWLHRLHFRVPSRDQCEPFAPVGLCPSGSLGSSGAWPPQRRASTTGPWPLIAAKCKAVSPQRPGFSELHSFDSQVPGMRIQDLH